MEQLSPRQREVLWWTAQGMGAKQVGQQLGITEQSVKNHMEHTRLKINARTTSHAVYLVYCQNEVTTA